MRGRPTRPARFLKTQQLFVATIPALVVVLSITGFVWAQKSVTVIVDGDATHLTTQATDVAGALRDASVEVGGRDLVTPSIEAVLADGETIVVRRAVSVALTVAGTSIPLDVVGSTVADALVAAGIDPSDALGVTPELTAPLRPGMHIVVPRAVVRVSEQTASLPFKTIKRSDANLPRGMRKVLTAGAAGRSLRVYRTVVTSGVEGERTLVSERVLAPPVDRVIAVGAASSVPAPTPARAVRARRTATHAAAPAPAKGRRFAVTATAYAPGSDGVDWCTATGVRAGLGIVAVDPKVIPLGTRIYVPGYGYGTAADTGGAIKGSRIDLCFETRSEAMLWGRRRVSIVVLD